MNADYTKWAQQAPAPVDAAIAAARRLQTLLMFPGNVYGYGSAMPAVLTPQIRPQPDVATPWAHLPDQAATFALLAERLAFQLGGLLWGLFKALSWAVPIVRALLEIRYLGQTPHRLQDPALVGLLGVALPATPPEQAVQQALRDLGPVRG